MPSIRFVFATIFIFAVFGCSCGDILSKDIKFDLFNGINASEYLAGLEKDVTTPTVTVERRGAVDTAVQYGKKLYQYLDYAGEAFRKIYDPETSLNQLLGKNDTEGKYRKSELDDLRDALKKIIEIEGDIKMLESEVSLLDSSDTEKATCLRERLAQILAKFNTESLSLQLYPTLTSPYLLQLAPIAVRLHSETDFQVFCKLAATIKQYFYSYLFDRLNLIEVVVHPDDYYFENKYTHIKTVSSAKFNVNPDEIDSIRCDKLLEGEDKYNSSKKELKNVKKEEKYLLVRDGMGTKGEYLYANRSECADDYMQLVRKKAEQKFAEAYNLVSRSCKGIVQPSGRGWIVGNLGAILVNAKCDRISGTTTVLEYFGQNKFEYCDPYVRVYVDTDQLYETEYQEDVIGWVPIEEPFHTEKLRKDSLIIIRVFDKDVGHPDDEMMSMTYEIQRSEMGDIKILPSQKFDQLFFNLHWIDEYTDESDTISVTRCPENNLTNNTTENSATENTATESTTTENSSLSNLNWSLVE